MNELHHRAGINPRHDGLNRLDLQQLFGNDHGVILEIGSGKGRFLVHSALAHHELNYLGIEKSLHYYRVIEERIRRRAVANAKIINHDAFEVLREMIPAKSISEIHIYFPDPWPRPRERKRRLIRLEVLQEMDRVLRDDGVGYYVTDHGEYFEKAAPELERVFDVELHRGIIVPPRTNYEEKYQKEGRPIYQATFRKKRQTTPTG